MTTCGATCDDKVCVMTTLDFSEIEAWKKSPTLADDFFICMFFIKSFIHFYYIFTEICAQWSKWQKVMIGLGNGLAPNRRQAITLTNDDRFLWCIDGLHCYLRPVWHSGIVVGCVCVSVRPCVNHELVRTITPFKLGSLNLDQMYKATWLRSLLFWGGYP